MILTPGSFEPDDGRLCRRAGCVILCTYLSPGVGNLPGHNHRPFLSITLSPLPLNNEAMDKILTNGEWEKHAQWEKLIEVVLGKSGRLLFV